MLGQSINVASYNLADGGGSMRKKRLFEFSLIIALSASFITLQINPARIASAQDAKVKKDGFITECSETVIDALDECIQERFSKSDMFFGAYSHNGNVTTAPSLTPPKAGDALGVAMYAYARKQKGASTLIR